MTEIQTLKICRIGEWLYIQNKTFEDAILRKGVIIGKKVKSLGVGLEKTAEEILQEVSNEKEVAVND